MNNKLKRYIGFKDSKNEITTYSLLVKETKLFYSYVNVFNEVVKIDTITLKKSEYRIIEVADYGL